MILLITGASHTGKTLLAQRLLEQHQFPYLSMDLLKMGLIRSGNTNLTPTDDGELEAYLWPIVREMIRTALENRQHLIVEGGYIPFDWQRGFSMEELREIRFYCLVMTASYIRRHFAEIKAYANAIERRLDDSECTLDSVLRENAAYEALCRRHGVRPVLIRDRYGIELG